MNRLIPLLSILALAVGTCSCYDASPPELYWHSVLPNTPIPSAISDLLHLSDMAVDKKTDEHEEDPDDHTTHPSFKCRVFADAVIDASSAVRSLFFLDKDLHPGAKLTLQFTRTAARAPPLLPRSVADLIPFSSAKLPEILTRFFIKPDSVQAQVAKETLRFCEKPDAAGVTEHCVTSLESMVDFAASSLGTSNLRALSTSVAKEGAARKQYTVRAVKKMAAAAGARLLLCHTADSYPYAVFYCHSYPAALYTASMVGFDGTAAEAVGVCHTGTTGWNPEFVGFQVLKVKPGTPVCHFLAGCDTVWAPSN